MENTQLQVHSHNPVVGATAGATVVKRRRAPSVKRAETKARKESDRGFPLPLALTCIVTGLTIKYTSLPYIRKLLAKYQTLENLKATYVSVEGRKIKQGG